MARSIAAVFLIRPLFYTQGVQIRSTYGLLVKYRDLTQNRTRAESGKLAEYMMERKEEMNDLRYPIGKFRFDGKMSEQERSAFIDQIEAAPGKLRAALTGLSPQQLDTPYRPGGWTGRQVVHHVPDSHLNSYMRFKLALTENEPTIKPYYEDRWAELEEARSAPVEISLALLEALHRRWVLMLRNIKAEEWSRTFRHPELGLISLEKNVALYAWHGRHHVAHITSLRERNGW